MVRSFEGSTGPLAPVDFQETTSSISILSIAIVL
jgi:hypothetical protein